jgi:hypothetical protein
MSTPKSIISIYVITPMVRDPSGSTFLASFNDSELARSSFPFEIAKINEFGF